METEVQYTCSLQAVGLFEGCFIDRLSSLSVFQVVQLIFLSSTQFALSFVFQGFGPPLLFLGGWYDLSLC